MSQSVEAAAQELIEIVRRDGLLHQPACECDFCRVLWELAAALNEKGGG